MEVGYWVCFEVWGQAGVGGANLTGKEMPIMLHPGRYWMVGACLEEWGCQEGRGQPSSGPRWTGPVMRAVLEALVVDDWVLELVAGY